MSVEAHDHFSAARLDGRGFVVLGAGGGGLGTATSQALAGTGARLLCVDREPNEAEAIASEVGGVAHVADVTDRSAMNQLFARAEELFGDQFSGVIDIVGAARTAEIASFNDQDFERQFDIVFRHALLTVQIAGPRLARRGGGSMVFVGSLSGESVVPNQGLYGASKAALHHLVRSAAHELGPAGVRVNVVSPGFVQTPRLKAALPGMLWEKIAVTNPMRRVAQPEDIAKVILFFASDLSAYVTGTVLPVDGGIGNLAALPTVEVPFAGGRR